MSLKARPSYSFNLQDIETHARETSDSTSSKNWNHAWQIEPTFVVHVTAYKHRQELLQNVIFWKWYSFHDLNNKETDHVWRIICNQREKTGKFSVIIRARGSCNFPFLFSDVISKSRTSRNFLTWQVSTFPSPIIIVNIWYFTGKLDFLYKSYNSVVKFTIYYWHYVLSFSMANIL